MHALLSQRRAVDVGLGSGAGRRAMVVRCACTPS